jgi:hypothetical protein
LGTFLAFDLVNKRRGIVGPFPGGHPRPSPVPLGLASSVSHACHASHASAALAHDAAGPCVHLPDSRDWDFLMGPMKLANSPPALPNEGERRICVSCETGKVSAKTRWRLVHEGSTVEGGGALARKEQGNRHDTMPLNLDNRLRVGSKPASFRQISLERATHPDSLLIFFYSYFFFSFVARCLSICFDLPLSRMTVLIYGPGFFFLSSNVLFNHGQAIEKAYYTFCSGILLQNVTRCGVYPSILPHPPPAVLYL